MSKEDEDNADSAVEDTLAEFDAVTVDTIPVELLGTIHTSKSLGCQTKGQSRF